MLILKDLLPHHSGQWSSFMFLFLVLGEGWWDKRLVQAFEMLHVQIRLGTGRRIFSHDAGVCVISDQRSFLIILSGCRLATQAQRRRL
jgi:hypothetical protein